MKVLFISVLVSATLIVSGQNNEPFATHTFSSLVASSIQSVEASTSGGSITVNGNSTSEAVVEMFVTRNNSGNSWSLFGRRNNRSDEDIKQILDEDYTIDIKVEGGKLYAVASLKNQRAQQRLNISFKISAPKQVNSDWRTSGGCIRISDLYGSHNFRTSGGSLTVQNISGNVVGRTSGGSITVTNSRDNINLTTSGGSITATDCSGNITLRTSGGSVRLTNLNGDINATTSGGSVRADNISGALQAGTSGGSMNLNGISGNLDARTSGGSITATMETVSNFVTLSNSGGSINLTIPVGNYDLKARGNNVQTSGLTNFSGRMDNKNLEGRIGNGGAKIELSTSGRASLSFK
jgi:DUF4097 and DUF4098 domain-containing protein YvlB